jgi:hypothetical protein
MFGLMTSHMCDKIDRLTQLCGGEGLYAETTALGVEDAILDILIGSWRSYRRRQVAERALGKVCPTRVQRVCARRLVELVRREKHREAQRKKGRVFGHVEVAGDAAGEGTWYSFVGLCVFNCGDGKKLGSSLLLLMSKISGDGSWVNQGINERPEHFHYHEPG